MSEQLNWSEELRALWEAKAFVPRSGRAVGVITKKN